MSEHFPARLTHQAMNTSMTSLRAPLTELHIIQVSVALILTTMRFILWFVTQAASVTNLLKGGAESKNRTVAWLCEALAVNSGAQASNPDVNKVSSIGLRLNMVSLLLSLSLPFVGDAAKEAKIATDSGFLSQSNGVFPQDLSLLQPAEAPVAPSKEGDVNFISQCFFLTWRALNLSIVQQLDVMDNMSQNYSHHYHTIMGAGGDPEVDPRLSQLLRHMRFCEVSEVLS